MPTENEQLTPIPYRQILIGIIVAIVLLMAFIFVRVQLANARVHREVRKIQSLVPLGTQYSDAVKTLQEAGYDPSEAIRPYETADYSQVLIEIGDAGDLVGFLNSWNYAITGGAGWFDVKSFVLIEVDDEGRISVIR